MLLTFENLSCILRLEPASQPQNLRAEPQELEQVTPSLLLYHGNVCTVYRMQAVGGTSAVIWTQSPVYQRYR